MLVENLRHTEGVRGVGDEQSTGVRADRAVSGDIDDRVGSLHLEADRSSCCDYCVNNKNFSRSGSLSTCF